MTQDDRYVLNVESPVGPLVLSATDDALLSLSWRRDGEVFTDRPNSLLKRSAKQLQRYFADGSGFDLPLAPRGTEFQKRGWRALAEILAGRTESYGALATRLGSAPRAVGGLCATNPIPIIVPCHRVVASGGRLGGFSGGTGLDTKQWLLRHEGALESLLI